MTGARSVGWPIRRGRGSRKCMDAKLEALHRRATLKMIGNVCLDWDPLQYGIDPVAVEGLAPTARGESLGGLRYVMRLRGRSYQFEVRHAGGTRFSVSCRDVNGGVPFTRMAVESQWQDLSHDLHAMVAQIATGIPPWRA
jgi:hypothetical protein